MTSFSSGGGGGIIALNGLMAKVCPRPAEAFWWKLKSWLEVQNQPFFFFINEVLHLFMAGGGGGGRRGTVVIQSTQSSLQRRWFVPTVPSVVCSVKLRQHRALWWGWGEVHGFSYTTTNEHVVIPNLFLFWNQTTSFTYSYQRLWFKDREEDEEFWLRIRRRMKSFG